MMKWGWLLRMTLPGPRELNGFPEGPPSLAHRASVSHEEVVKRATLWFRLVWISRGMQVVTSPVGLADFCPNQADRRDSAAASFWTPRLLGGLPGFLWCATNAAAICGHIVAHSGVRYSTQDKLFQPCCHPRLWAPSAHVFTAANADTAFFGVFPNLLHQSGQNKSQRDVSCYAQKYLSHPKIGTL